MRTTTRNSKYPRRKRPLYPTLAQLPRGEQALMERRECGVNIENATVAKLEKRARRVIKFCFVFARPLVPPSRSQYEPHVGARQLARGVAA